MLAKRPDPLLVLAIDLNTAAACLLEAATELTGLLRARSGTTSACWHDDYAISCSYFTRAHQEYVTRAAAFTAEITKAESSPEHSNGHLATNDQYVAQARAASRRIAATSAVLRSLIEEVEGLNGQTASPDTVKQFAGRRPCDGSTIAIGMVEGPQLDSPGRGTERATARESADDGRRARMVSHPPCV